MNRFTRVFPHFRCRSFSVFLCLVLVPPCFGAEPALPPPPKEPIYAFAGSLVLHGGGPVADSVREHFLELAGGKNARLVIVPTAAIGADDSEVEKGLESWKNAEVVSLVALHTRKREEANDDAFIKPLTEATGVWLDGGDAGKLLSAYAGTLVEKELKKLLARGGVIGGSAEGISVLGQVVLGSNPRGAPRAGFDLLSGFVIDPHFLKQNRMDRLLGLLANRPGCVGLGIDQNTALVVKGRGMTVIGDSYVVTCLSASSKRPAGIQTLKAGDRADLVALSRAAIARAQPPHPPDKPPTPNVGKGTLIIGGGGGMPEAVWKQFVELAGGPDGLIVVVPTAMDDPVPEEPVEARLLKRAGAKNIKLLHTRKRSEADTADFCTVLKEAKGVWFSGGRQWRFVDSYLGTATEKAFHDVLERGGVIGGSSAGASIQADYMVRGDPLGNLKMMAEGYERGFGFCKGVAIDQHFFARRRTADMTELMTVHPQLLGIGIDEGTVIIVHGSIMEVVGRSKVAVYDRRKPLREGEKDYEELPAGTRYDLDKRQRLVND